MESPFAFNKPVTGKNHIGRKQEVTVAGNLISQGENIAIYDSPKTGKTSLIRQTFYSMRVNGKQFSPIEFSLLNIRTEADLMMRLGSTVLQTALNRAGDWDEAVRTYLDGTHFVFDEKSYGATGILLSLNWDLDDNDIRAIFELPYKVAAAKGMPVYLVLDEFQNVMLMEDGEKLCSILYRVFSGLTPEQKACCSYIFLGSQMNAMKHIFETGRLFYRKVEHLALPPIDTKELIDHIIRGFLTSGKVIDRELLLGVCKLFRNHPWYIDQFASICDSLSKGYLTEPILVEALEILLSVHEPGFVTTMNGLTTFQVCLLRAIIDGHTKFSSSEVVHRYNLNSSANVLRLKDALCRKEIITFNGNDEPVILDPLFEYWVRKYYFEIKSEQ